MIDVFLLSPLILGALAVGVVVYGIRRIDPRPDR